MAFFTTKDGVRLCYEICGRGKPVIFIHGLTAGRRHFKYQASGLKTDFSIITYDLRGHGDSQTPDHQLSIPHLAGDLKDLINHLGLQRVSLVGWSMGAHVIFDYIRQFTDHDLDRICIIDMTPRLLKSDGTDGLGPWRLGLKGLNGQYGDFDLEDNLKTLEVLGSIDWKIFAKSLSERQFDKAFIENGMLDTTAAVKGKNELPWLVEQARRNKAPVIIAFWVSMSAQDFRELLPKITVPALIAFGRGSNYYAPETSLYMEKTIPNARAIGFDGCGHALHLQDPEAFNAVLNAFLS